MAHRSEYSDQLLLVVQAWRNSLYNCRSVFGFNKNLKTSTFFNRFNLSNQTSRRGSNDSIITLRSIRIYLPTTTITTKIYWILEILDTFFRFRIWCQNWKSYFCIIFSRNWTHYQNVLLICAIRLKVKITDPPFYFARNSFRWSKTKTTWQN